MAPYKRTPSYDKPKNANKEAINTTVVDCMKSMRCKNALINDGDKMRTTHYLHQQLQMPLNKITSVEINPRVHHKHLKNGIHSYHGELWNDVVRFKNPHKPYDALLLDTVNSLSTLVRGKNIENLFCNGFVGPKSVVLLTGVKRSALRDSCWKYNYRRLKDIVRKVAKKYNYKCRLHVEQEQTKVISVVYIVEQCKPMVLRSSSSSSLLKK